jgi:hypothetical protein
MPQEIKKEEKEGDVVEICESYDFQQRPLFQFFWGWDGANFMPITSQIAIYNWFRFVLGKFE